MATYSAISSVSKAIVRLFDGAFPRETLGSVVFLPVIGLEFTEGLKDTVTVFFYRFDISASGRVARRNSRVEVKRKPPLPLDLYFMITPWITDPDRQQRTLGWILQTVHDNPTLPSQYLNADMDHRSFEAHESVDLACEPMKLQDIAGFHDSYKVRFPASLFVTAKFVLIESAVDMIEAGLVKTRVFETGPAA